MKLFCGKKSYSLILSLRNITGRPVQQYVLLILQHSRLAWKRTKV